MFPTLTRLFVVILWVLLPVAAWAESGAHEETGIPRAVLYAAINFSILAGLLIFFLRKPAKEFFATRATLIRTHISEAQELKTQAQRRYAEIEKRLQGVDGESKKLLETLKQDGALEQGRIVQTAQEQAAALKLTSEKIIGQELRKAKEELKREAVGLAAEMAEKLIRDNISAQDQNRLVNEYLAKMENLS